MVSHFSGGMVCSGPPNQPTPALLTRMSSLPKVFCTRSDNAITEFQSPTSQAMASACLPEARICAAECCSRQGASTHDDIAAQRGQLLCNRGSNPTSATGYQRNFVVENI